LGDLRDTCEHLWVLSAVVAVEKGGIKSPRGREPNKMKVTPHRTRAKGESHEAVKLMML